ncbi:MAG: hypothetical protein CMO55_23405 [Verrucomicrobiales bacterium]|nr:hypothetical protein [Verrucomicrobiales bacterium]
MKANMKISFYLALGICATSLGNAEDVPFPAGDFETNPALNWTVDGDAGFETVTENTFGRVAPQLIGGAGALTATAAPSFQSDSLYRVTLDVASASLLALSSESFRVQVLDGSDAVVAELTQDQLVGLLGLDLTIVNSLTTDLNLLDGGVSDDLLLQGIVRDLLEALASNGDSDVFGAVQSLIESLVGADQSVITEVVALLGEVLGGNLDPGSLTSLDIANLLELDPSNDIVVAVEDLLGFVLGNEGPVENLVAVLEALLGDSGDLGDLDLINDLLATLAGEQELVESVANILNLSLVEDLLGGLSGDDTLSLLGILDPSGGEFKEVSLLFVVEETAPAGEFKIRLSAESLLSAGFTADFDNVAAERFDLVSTPVDVPGNVTNTRPLIRAKRQRVIRVTNRPRVKITGVAKAFGEGNSITRVQVAVRGRGARPGERRFRNRVKGTENWRARVRVPVGDRNRVIFRAFDATGKKSVTSLVRVRRVSR